MATGPELLRQYYLETTQGETDPRVTAALELQRRWLLVHSSGEPGGTLWQHQGIMGGAEDDTVLIAWRPLDINDAEDWEIIRFATRDPSMAFLPECRDWLMGMLSGDQLIVSPYAIRLLKPYELPAS